jgi:hypothetical protein
LFWNSYIITPSNPYSHDTILDLTRCFLKRVPIDSVPFC